MATNWWDEALGMQSLAIQDPWMANAAGSATSRATLTGNMTPWYQRGTGGAGATAASVPSAGVPQAPSAVNNALASFTGGGGSFVGGGAPGLPGGDSGFGDIQSILKGLLPQFSQESATSSAQALMEQRAQLEREKNMPAIQRAIEGAGTSGSSMGALLSQRAARDTAQASAALGAEQQKAFGGIQANLAGALAQLTASGDPRSRLLASILETQMQTDASRSNAQTAASAQNTANATRSVNDFATQQQLMDLQQQQRQPQQQSATNWMGNFSTFNSGSSSGSRY